MTIMSFDFASLPALYFGVYHIIDFPNHSPISNINWVMPKSSLQNTSFLLQLTILLKGV